MEIICIHENYYLGVALLKYYLKASMIFHNGGYYDGS